MRAAKLFSIDLVGQLRTLCAEQLHGSWQLPAELIRYAIRRGAAAAEIEGAGRGFVLRCPGTGSVRMELEALAVALDPAAPDRIRHDAMVALERNGAQALLWTAGTDGRSLRIAGRSLGSATVFRVRPERRPRIVVDAPDDVVGGFEVELQLPGFDGARALSWARLATRFAPVPVTVDGREVEQGFDRALCTVSLGSPVTGGIALTRTGDVPRLWLLRHGVLAARATLPGRVPFEAAVELGDLTQEGASPDELRSAIGPHLDALTDRAARLLLDALNEGGRGEGDLERESRLTTLALCAAAAGPRSADVAAAESLWVMENATGARRRCSLDEVRNLVGRGEVLWSVSPGIDPARLPRDDRTLLLLTEEQRDLLSELLGARLPRPEPRHRLGRRPWSMRALRDRLARWASELLPFGDRAALPANQLLAAERRLIREIERTVTDPAGDPVTARFVAGDGRVRWRQGELLVPRHQPRVVRAVKLVDEGEQWLYPALLALVGEHGRVSEELRDEWREIVHSER